MQVKEVMTRGVETLNARATVQEAAETMRSQDVGIIPIVEGNDVIGTVTDRDIVIRAIAAGKDPRSTTVTDILTPEIVYCYEDADVQEAADRMIQRQLRRVMVLDRDDKIVGIASVGDLSTGDVGLSGEVLRAVSEASLSKEEDRVMSLFEDKVNPLS